MSPELETLILQHFHATAISSLSTIQPLWSGYGDIVRVGLTGCERASIIVKHIQLGASTNHPKGWNSDRSHQRKLQSYRVEQHWYAYYAPQCDRYCTVPECLFTAQHDNDTVIMLSDLNEQGFPRRHEVASIEQIHACLRWLAFFHACFIQAKPTGLWETGNYWHLTTRPDEHQAMADSPLKHAATSIDKALKACRYQTLIHGDAKLANFCFSEDGGKAAAVDFQYVGKGIGIIDVAYFIGSCVDDEHCFSAEEPLLDYYFQQLSQALAHYHPQLDAEAIEQCWRQYYDLAWADFRRFLLGWSPGHWKLGCYSEFVTERALAQLSLKLC